MGRTGCARPPLEKPPRDGEAARASSWNANAEEEEEEEVRALPVNGAADAPTSRWMTLVPLCTCRGKRPSVNVRVNKDDGSATNEIQSPSNQRRDAENETKTGSGQ